jgi:SNF2 family DNA or RNA helicase
MKILHGTWIPKSGTDFVRTGAFYLWVETDTIADRDRDKSIDSNISRHPQHLVMTELREFLADSLGIQPINHRQFPEVFSSQYFLLPSHHDRPLPSLELARYLETDLPDTFDLGYWQIDCYQIATLNDSKLVSNVTKLLKDIHFLTINDLTEVQMGADLLFWYHYTQSLRQVILKDQYIPALRYHPIEQVPAKSAKKTKKNISAPIAEIYPAWEIISEQYTADIDRYSELMPLACVSGFSTIPDAPILYDRAALLKHFSTCLLTEIIANTPSTATVDKQIDGSLLQMCWQQTGALPGNIIEIYEKWQTWRDKIARSQSTTNFYLCFHLQEPLQPEKPWILSFQVAAKNDPSRRVPTDAYWELKGETLKSFQQQFGADFEQHLLMNLGYAARIYPKLWAGLETDKPTQLKLSTEETLDFLKESAWILEDAGYKVIIPAWWTPQGRRRAKLKLKATGRKASGGGKKKSYFSFDTIVEYHYELAIGNESVSTSEWQELVDNQSQLVQFRGQWLELDQSKMQEMLAFWQKNQADTPELDLLDLMKLAARENSDIEVDFDRDELLSEIMGTLGDKSRIEVLPEPKLFNGKLREYQQRGVAWLNYLESLGLNGCLADDMGMGKTVQVIARLVQERELATAEELAALPPTLLIAPTSVVSNWQKEIYKFAPHLRSLIHHGSQREQDLKVFKNNLQACDVLITSFTLARKDEKLFGGVEWQRLVVDEAQNLKNPKAAQTKAINKIPAQHRLALTGTPVENRLLDLWSIFNFLNPGYLGKEAQFRKLFEVPIQRENDRVQSVTLKKLVEPFILRRVKTDPAIIQDLPDKVEQKLYCNLTKEQAALYEATVKDVEDKLNDVEGIQRKGLILSTMLKLKQICNHPRQFLQDNSDFTPERSHKLDRLTEMVKEVVAEGESLLVFTQFTDIGEALVKYCKSTLRANTYYIHGGTSRDKREQMITSFQDPDTEPTIFILSLKAGGVGITLTKANHVFHFDRWWNPAVEDQATDRAFRIGQKKNVFVHKFVTLGTLEEKIDEMIEDKKKLAGSIVGADESWLTELDNNAFKKLIALNRDTIMD